MKQSEKMHRVDIYDIAHDKTNTRLFHNATAAHHYADNLKRVLLNRPNPAPVHIEVMPA